MGIISSPGNEASIRQKIEAIHERLQAELPGIDRVSVAIYDDRTDVVKTFVHSTHGDVPFAHYEEKLTDVPSLRCLAESASPRIIADFETWLAAGSAVAADALAAASGDGGAEDPQPHSRIDRLRRCGYQSSYTLPFYDHGRFFGFLFYDSRQSSYFSPSVVRHLALYSHLISLLIIHEVSRASVLRSAIDVARKITHSRNEETGAHLDRMARYARLIAKTLADRNPDDEIDDEFVEFVFLYAPLHDVGKIAVPDRILLKPDKLTEDEFAIMKRHVAAGLAIVESIAASFHIGSGQHVDVLRNIVRFHHEAFDGSGYLEGRRARDIPLEARIVTVADVFDALTTRRCYKEAWPNEAAFDLLDELAGKRFDPECVAALRAHRTEVELLQTRFQSDNVFHEAYLEDL